MDRVVDVPTGTVDVWDSGRRVVDVPTGTVDV